MWINGCDVDDDLFRMYCRSIVLCHQAPTKAYDQARRDMHERLLAGCGVSRECEDFARELNRLAWDEIHGKIARAVV